MDRSRFSKITVLILTFIMLGSAAVYAAGNEAEDQEINVDVTGSKEGYSAVLYDNSNGLPTSEANAIAERTALYG